MTHQFRSLLRTVLIGILLAPLLVVIDLVAGGSAAQARCVSVNRGVRSTLLDYVYEEPLAGTCNNNGYYQGRFVLTRGDGVPFVYIQNGGEWREFRGSTNNSWVDYEYADSNSTSWMTLCYHITRSGHVYCGWGNNLLFYEGFYRRTSDFNDSRYHGVNTGY
jgi:hypothetical protein